MLGQWDVLPLGPQGAEVLACHAALLDTGKVLYFAGSEHDQAAHDAHQFDHSRLWNPATGLVEPLDSPDHDLFCAGHAFLGDGRLVVAGGTHDFPVVMGPGQDHDMPYTGLRDTTIFDPAQAFGSNWVPAALMNPERGKLTGGGRWYPMLVTLGNGQIFAMSGLPGPGDTRPTNIMVEVFDPSGAPPGAWIDRGDQASAPAGYPRLHLLPDGQVLCVTPMAAGTLKWDPVGGAWTKVANNLSTDYLTFDTSSVLLPLSPADGHRARVLAVGAKKPRILDLGASKPSWKGTSPRTLAGSPKRRHLSATLLADGAVLVSGGVQTTTDATAVLAAERYDPATGQWATLASATVTRQYHSVALLLPDGRVWTAGSNFNGQGGVANRELRIELYSPPYLFAGPRPTISAAPSTLTLPSVFEIGTPDANAIATVNLLRCGSATHAFNFDQRCVRLAIQSRTVTTLTVASPPTHNVAPPGYYLLFILNAGGVPSVGSFVQVT